jgi:two-component system, chemotaxis family, chemotaxis protein CheY
MNKRILVVDDSPAIRKLVSFTLEFAGYEVTMAEDGVKGLQRLQAEAPFDLVFVDIIMPNMGGLEFMQKVRADATHGALPLVVLSTEGRDEDIQNGTNAGATSYLVKPFQPPALLAKVKEIMAEHQPKESV